jgi:hypothetical protein
MRFNRYHAVGAAAVAAAGLVSLSDLSRPPGNWRKMVDQGQTFAMSVTPQYVRFGKGTQWTVAIKQAGGPCTAAFFGNIDPAPGVTKQCDIASGPAVVGNPPGGPTNHSAGLPVSDTALATAIAGLQPGVNTVELGAPNPSLHGGIDYSQTFTGRRPQWPDVDYEGRFGDFRTTCNTAWIRYDDAIVLPGQEGASHNHTGAGNTKVDYDTVESTIRTRNSPKGSCVGGAVNFSGYWVPTMLKGPMDAGIPVVPDWLLYYKPGNAGYWYQGPDIISLPLGLVMVSGDAKRTVGGGIPDFHCTTRFTGGLFPAGNPPGEMPQNCPYQQPSGQLGAGEQLRLWMGIGFNQCWDGTNLDSTNHKDHLAAMIVNGPGITATTQAGSPGAQQYKCPDTHPYIIPQITIIPMWPVPPGETTSGWRLASDVYLIDNPSGGHGWSGHADWMNGWDPAILTQMVNGCSNKPLNCGSFFLGWGDGREGLEFQGN